MATVDGETHLRTWRIFVGASLILAPLGQLIANLIRPRTPTEPSEMLRVIADHEGAYLASILISIPALILYLPAAGGLVHLLGRGRGVAIGIIGAGLLAMGAVGLACFLAVGFMYLEMVDPAANRQEMVALLDRYGQGIGFYFLFGLFLVGFQLGSLLLGSGLRAAGAVPRWIATAIILAAIGSAIAAPLGFPEVLSAAFLTVGLGSIGARVLRMSTYEWDRIGSDDAAI